VKLSNFFDPDSAWFSQDKFQHGASFFIVGLVTAIGYNWWLGLVLTKIGIALAVVAQSFVIGLVYELGQTDTAYSVTKYYGLKLLGQPGFGISPLDLVWDVAGATLATLLWLAWPYVF